LKTHLVFHEKENYKLQKKKKCFFFLSDDDYIFYRYQNVVVILQNFRLIKEFLSIERSKVWQQCSLNMKINQMN